MKLSVLVFINALAVAITLSMVNFYFQHKWYDVAVTFSLSFITSYIVFYYLIEKYVYSKVKLIYKLIHNLNWAGICAMPWANLPAPILLVMWSRR
jgi:two-component system phosphate regulon sensor histidine kinase PhoR